MTIRWPSGEKATDQIRAAVPLEGEQFLAAGRLPHLGRLIPTAGDNPLAVRGKGHRPNPAAVPLEGEQFLAAGRIPDLGRLILTARDNPLAVRGKGHGPNRSCCAP